MNFYRKMPKPKRKAIPKKLREEIRMKFGGRCAYCGCDVSVKMQVDHVVPLELGGTNDPKNLFPSCPPCNNFKLTMTVEVFRSELQAQVERAQKYSVNYRMAKKHGLVVETCRKVVFHFEKSNKENA